MWIFFDFLKQIPGSVPIPRPPPISNPPPSCPSIPVAAPLAVSTGMRSSGSIKIPSRRIRCFRNLRKNSRGLWKSGNSKQQSPNSSKRKTKSAPPMVFPQPPAKPSPPPRPNPPPQPPASSSRSKTNAITPPKKPHLYQIPCQFQPRLNKPKKTRKSKHSPRNGSPKHRRVCRTKSRPTRPSEGLQTNGRGKRKRGWGNCVCF